jgi:aldehyde dehydrogenase (NAD+)
MSQTHLPEKLAEMKRFFDSGATRPYAFRKQQLKLLKAALQKHEQLLYDALYTDLNKNPEEVWVTEAGFLMTALDHALKSLRTWMAPEKVSTNLVNFPSSSYVLYEPLGVVLIIAPWNYPLQLLLAPLIGAIAAGNCAVLKPSELAPATAAAMRKLIQEIFPEQYVLYAEGDGAEVVPAMMNHFRFDHVFYTGGINTGRNIYRMAAEQLVPVTLELGGKSPAVVEADANIRVAARRIAVTKFSNAGQMCVAPDYVLVHASKKEQLVQEIIKAIVSFYTKDPSSDYHYGKIINEKQFTRLVGYLNQGHVTFGGRYDAQKLYIEPTILENVSPDSPVMKEEIFGPILPVLSFNSMEEAKEIVRQNPNPLAFYVYTSSAAIEKAWLESVPFGGGCVNNCSWHFTNQHLPFGGRGNSGMGQYHGRYSFELFSHRKGIMKSPTWFDPAIKYPPFKGKLKLFKWLVR